MKKLLVASLLLVFAAVMVPPPAEAGGGRGGAIVGGIIAGILIDRLLLQGPVVIQPYAYPLPPRSGWHYPSHPSVPPDWVCYTYDNCWRQVWRQHPYTGAWYRAWERVP